MRRDEVFGLLGPNGAGKTTMLSMLATVLPIEEGEATIFGVDMRREQADAGVVPRRGRRSAG